MRRLATLAAAALLAAAAAPAGAAAPQSARLLAAEYALAQKPKGYFVLDLRERRVQLKVRGMLLKEMPLGDAEWWGPPRDLSPRALQSKDSLATPVRPEIRPGEEKSVDQLDAQLLELNDMPAAYQMHFGGGVEVSVFPRVAGFGPTWRRRLETLRWRLSESLRLLRGAGALPAAVHVRLVMRDDDARSLYWSCYEGIEGILVFP